MSDQQELPPTPSAEPTTPPPAVVTPATPPPTVNAPVKSGNGDQQPTIDPQWLQGRLNRASEKAVSDLLESLGVKSVDDIKATQAAAREAEQLKMTEAQRIEAEKTALILERDKAIKRAEKFEKEQADLATNLSTVKSTVVTDRITSKLEVAALKAGAEHPEDVAKMLRDDFRTEFTAAADEEGQIKKEAIDALIVKAKEARPTWFSKGGGPTQPGSPSNFNGRAIPPQNPRDKSSRLNQRIIRG